MLDADGEPGLKELKSLTAVHGPLPQTLTARTGRGAHFYFAYKGKDVPSSARGHPHLRANSGYVLLPPSKHASGRQYEWFKSIPAAPVPNWLKEWMQGGGSRARKAKSEDTTLSKNAPEHCSILPNRGLVLRALNAHAVPWTLQEEIRLRSALCAIPASIATTGSTSEWLFTQRDGLTRARCGTSGRKRAHKSTMKAIRKGLGTASGALAAERKSPSAQYIAWREHTDGPMALCLLRLMGQRRRVRQTNTAARRLAGVIPCSAPPTCER